MMRETKTEDHGSLSNTDHSSANKLFFDLLTDATQPYSVR